MAHTTGRSSCSTVKHWGSLIPPLASCVSLGKWLHISLCPNISDRQVERIIPARMAGRKRTSRVKVPFYVTHLASQCAFLSPMVRRKRHGLAPISRQLPFTWGIVYQFNRNQTPRGKKRNKPPHILLHSACQCSDIQEKKITFGDFKSLLELKFPSKWKFFKSQKKEL